MKKAICLLLSVFVISSLLFAQSGPRPTLAKCVVNGIIAAKLPFAKYRVGDWKPFDPARPDPMDAFKLPPDPQLDPNRPGVHGAMPTNGEPDAVSPPVNLPTTTATNGPASPPEPSNSPK